MGGGGEGGGGGKRGWRRDRADRELVTAAHGVDAFGASVVDENVARARLTFTQINVVVVCSGMQIQLGTRPAENVLDSPGFNWKALVGRLRENSILHSASRRGDNMGI